jgi:hypothetical protein
MSVMYSGLCSWITFDHCVVRFSTGLPNAYVCVRASVHVCGGASCARELDTLKPRDFIVGPL